MYPGPFGALLSAPTIQADTQAACYTAYTATFIACRLLDCVLLTVYAFGADGDAWRKNRLVLEGRYRFRRKRVSNPAAGPFALATANTTGPYLPGRHMLPGSREPHRPQMQERCWWQARRSQHGTSLKNSLRFKLMFIPYLYLYTYGQKQIM